MLEVVKTLESELKVAFGQFDKSNLLIILS